MSAYIFNKYRRSIVLTDDCWYYLNKNKRRLVRSEEGFLNFNKAFYDEQLEMATEGAAGGILEYASLKFENKSNIFPFNPSEDE